MTEQTLRAALERTAAALDRIKNNLWWHMGDADRRLAEERIESACAALNEPPASQPIAAAQDTSKGDAEGRMDKPDVVSPVAAASPSLLQALRFYAGGQHYHADPDTLDSVSGEPANWLCNNADEPIALTIEDGGIARMALRGLTLNWMDGDEDNTPLPIEGDVYAAASPSSLDDETERQFKTNTPPEVRALLGATPQEKSAAPIAQEPLWTPASKEWFAEREPKNEREHKVWQSGWQQGYAAKAAAPQVAQEPVAPEALEHDLIVECERAMKQRDEFLRTGVSTAAHGGSHDTCFGYILRKHRAAPIAAPAGSDEGNKFGSDSERATYWKKRCKAIEGSLRADRFERTCAKLSQSKQEIFRLNRRLYALEAASPTAPDMKKGET